MAGLRGKRRLIHSGRREALTARAIRMYERYGGELESLRQLLHMRLSLLAAAYTLHHGLPSRSVRVETRVKTLGSFLHKLERRDWPAFYYPEEVIFDLIGGRFISWFVDDCYGILDTLRHTHQFTVADTEIEDYIGQPKPNGYRSVHLLAHMAYDRVSLGHGQPRVGPASALIEIQIRTQLQHWWAEITQDMHRGDQAVPAADYTALQALGQRLAAEDERCQTLRSTIQRRWADAAHRRL